MSKLSVLVMRNDIRADVGYEFQYGSSLHMELALHHEDNYNDSPGSIVTVEIGPCSSINQVDSYIRAAAALFHPTIREAILSHEGPFVDNVEVDDPNFTAFSGEDEDTEITPIERFEDESPERQAMLTQACSVDPATFRSLGTSEQDTLQKIVEGSGPISSIEADELLRLVGEEE